MITRPAEWIPSRICMKYYDFMQFGSTRNPALSSLKPFGLGNHLTGVIIQTSQSTWPFIQVNSLTYQPYKKNVVLSLEYFAIIFVAWNLVPSCCWKNGLGKLSTILEMESLLRQLQVPYSKDTPNKWLGCTVCCPTVEELLLGGCSNY